MAHEQFEACISACNNCADACDHCATACLDEKNVAAMVRCIKLNQDGRDPVRTVVSTMPMARSRLLPLAPARIWAVVTVVAMLFPAGAGAANVPTPLAGALDPTFGHRGKVLTQIIVGGPDHFATDVAVQADGKILVTARGASVSDFVVVRYDPDGDLDPTFGGDGKVVTPIGGYAYANAVAVQPDGKIVVAGHREPYPSNLGDWAVVRYLPDGSLDTAFGTGGIVITPWEETSTTRLSDDVANALAIDTTDPERTRIVVGGVSNIATGDDFALARYNSDGSLDNSFGIAGKVLTNVSVRVRLGIPTASSDEIRDLTILPGGGIVAGGLRFFGSHDFAVIRYLESGAVDLAFGDIGRAITDFGGSEFINSIALDGEYLIALGTMYSFNFGSVKRLVAIARYTGDGDLDPSFDHDGRIELDLGGVGKNYGEGIAVVGDRYIIAGSSQDGSSSYDLAYDFALARLMRDGSFDDSFGDGGTVLTDLSGTDFADAMAIQPDGKVLVTGSSSSAIGLVRYLVGPPRR